MNRSVGRETVYVEPGPGLLDDEPLLFVTLGRRLELAPARRSFAAPSLAVAAVYLCAVPAWAYLVFAAFAP